MILKVEPDDIGGATLSGGMQVGVWGAELPSLQLTSELSVGIHQIRSCVF